VPSMPRMLLCLNCCCLGSSAAAASNTCTPHAQQPGVRVLGRHTLSICTHNMEQFAAAASVAGMLLHSCRTPVASSGDITMDDIHRVARYITITAECSLATPDTIYCCPMDHFCDGVHFLLGMGVRPTVPLMCMLIERRRQRPCRSTMVLFSCRRSSLFLPPSDDAAKLRSFRLWLRSLQQGVECCVCFEPVTIGKTATPDDVDTACPTCLACVCHQCRARMMPRPAPCPVCSMRNAFD
jgi:hypothetical protein